MASARGWSALCTLVVSLELPPKRITIINLIVHGNPKGDRCPQIKSLRVESRILQALREAHVLLLELLVHPLASILQGLDFISTASWWTEMPEAVRSDTG